MTDIPIPEVASANKCACAEFQGFYAAALACHRGSWELDDIVTELREAGNYVLSDRIRAIAKRLLDAGSYPIPISAVPPRYETIKIPGG